jgi:hypothetical protein
MLHDVYIFIHNSEALSGALILAQTLGNEITFQFSSLLKPKSNLFLLSAISYGFRGILIQGPVSDQVAYLEGFQMRSIEHD